ncbi:Cutinase transcription factor 1 beta [Apiospora arundinis]
MAADNEAVALPGPEAETDAALSSSRSPEPQTQDLPPSPTTTATQNPEEKDSAGLTPSKKRSASHSEPSGSTKVTKRRAARACVSCRARKVRCDVVEGAPCGNCRWDNVECVVQESRRRKPTATSPVNISPAPDVRRQSEVSLAASINVTPAEAAAANAAISQQVAQSTCTTSFPDGSGLDGHVPSLISLTAGLSCATDQQQSDARTDPVLLLAQLQQSANNGPGFPNLWSDATAGFSNAKTAQFLNTLEEPDASSQLPGFIRPLPSKIAPEDVNYLHLKGGSDVALARPSKCASASLCRIYGLYGQISLFLYHAVMFASTAYVDVKFLKEAGYPSRKSARKAFFQKTRLLYDFDYESDRLILVQALLLMTYWYETPDDQKDTWHWMGVAISLAHTIGLHRNPANTNMSLRKQKLWKRIWWSCFMRDRLIALGMRRPTRIKDEDYDVPMLDEGDFEIGPLADEIQVVNHDCTLVRDVLMQQELASMCVAKAKLCLCISQMLKAQYSVLLDNIELVNEVDISLMAWVQALPACCQYRPLTQLDLRDGHKTIAVQRNLLHMVYYTTISALHRPQFLHSSPLHVPTTSRQAQEMSRMKVRDSAAHITRMVNELHQLKLEKYLPTTGVTVILPAMIIHLLEMKNNVAQARDKAVQGFLQCMKVMVKLRDSYAAADYAVAFLDAALRKAAIDLQASQQAAAASTTANVANAAANTAAVNKSNAAFYRAPAAVVVAEEMATPPPENLPYMTQPEAALMNPSTVYVPPAELMHGVGGIAGNSPPETNKDGFTPSASGAGSSNGSDGGQPPTLDVEMDFADHDQDEFDWNALTGTNIDFDQWLHFPGDNVAAGGGGGAKAPNNAAAENGAADPLFNIMGDGAMVKG